MRLLDFRRFSGTVTYFATHYPDFPVPNLIEIAAGVIMVHDETERVKKVKAVQARAEVRQMEQRIHFSKEAVEAAQERLRIAQRELVHAEGKMKQVMGDE